jgi:hypothetical protein
MRRYRRARAVGAAWSASLALVALLAAACGERCEPCAAGGAGGCGDPADAPPGDVRGADPGTAPDAVTADVADPGPPADGGRGDASDAADAGGAAARDGLQAELGPTSSDPCWLPQRGPVCSPCGGRGDCQPDLDCLDDDDDPATARVCTRACASDRDCPPSSRCQARDAGGDRCRCEGCASLSVTPGVTCEPSGAATEWRDPRTGEWHGVYVIPTEHAAATWGASPLVPRCWGDWVWSAAPPDDSAWWSQPDGTWCRRFRRVLDLPEGVHACVELSADDAAQVRLNGRLLAVHPVPPVGGPARTTGVHFLPEAGQPTALEFCVCSTGPSYAGLLFNVHYR